MATTIDPGSAQQLVIANVPASNAGMADVALLYPSGSDGGVLTYTAVDVGSGAALLRTRIASSSDEGASWSYLADVNTPVTTTIDSSDTAKCPSGTCQGNIVNEVSTVNDDASDPDASRRWKVLTHRYFWLNPGGEAYAYGHIALYTAPSPSGPWSAATPLVGWPSQSTFSSSGALNTTASLGLGCAFLTEPTAAVVGSQIWVAVGCVVASPLSIQVELLSSTDHLATLSRVGTLLDAADASALGAPAARLNAADLFVAGGSPYLLVSPGNSAGNYLGCDLLRLDPSGAVIRDASGAPIVLRRFDASNAPQRGACSFAEGATHTGYVINVPQASPLNFRVFLTGVDSL